MELYTFSEALKNCKSQPRLLLGNGFSQACLPKVFSYKSLFEAAKFEKLSPQVKNAFNALGTEDFEIVMDGLIKASKLVGLYSKHNDLAECLSNNANELRELLVATIANSHPAMPSEIETERYAACRRFLSGFDKIYSLNYDLLLYWALMSDRSNPNEELSIRFDDGFRSSGNDKADYVTWDIENSYNQNVFYLHGALHLFDAGAELQKYTWCKTGTRIIDQVSEALSKELYPVFVAEGTSISKLTRIKHSDYLSRGYRSLCGIGGNLFIYGHSLGESDKHIFSAIIKGKIANLYISIYGDPESTENKNLIETAHNFSQMRRNENPLNIFFYDASSANVWGNN